MLGRMRYAYLLATLALLIVGRPFLPDFGRGLVLALLGLSLVTAAVTSATKRYQVWVGLALTAVILVTSLMSRDAGGVDIGVISPTIGVVYWGFTAFLVLRRVLLDTTRVSIDAINGAVCVYLMMGLGWAQAYTLLTVIEPTSFSFNGEIIAASAHAFELFIGFSFITLTTLGYGNVVPMTPRADALAIAEAIAGQLYLAVLLARLVALEIAGRRRD